ncbi:MAG: PIG-L family deacetylase [Chloroflexi bacterium]|nr:PIG-L family deacetylase [Chloroflexota bacterium]
MSSYPINTPDNSFRTWLRSRMQQSLFSRPQTPSIAELKQSAIIFSPHQDDETLGCGGMILKKTAVSAPIKLVFLADGRSSHGHLMPPTDLVALREEEAIAASQLLGIDKSHISFWRYPDGQIYKYEREAVETAVSLLQKTKPDQVFIPYRFEPPPDHAITNHIVRQALKRYGKPVTVYEYPIWIWNHWPWVSLRQNRWAETRSIIKSTLFSGLGIHFQHRFQYAVDVSDKLPQKKAALDQHKSQMTRLLPRREWLTLADVAGGEFLDCFFQAYELFCRYQVNHKKS